MESRIEPKPTSRTTAFKVMLAAWLANALVIYLAKRGVFVPDELKGGLAEALAEGINAGLPVVTTVLTGWVTKVVVQMSADKSVEKTRAAAELVHLREAESLKAERFER